MNFDNPDEWLEEHLAIKAMTFGLSLRMKDEKYGLIYKNMPITTQALELPRLTYQRLIAIQPALNRVLINMSRDLPFLERVLENCDSFTRQILELHKSLLQEKPHGIASIGVLGVFRIDYIVVDDGTRPKQVEMNTIAAGLAGVMPRVMAFHRDTHALAHKKKEAYNPPEMDKFLPVPEAMAKAHRFYNEVRSKVSAGNDSSCSSEPKITTAVLFVIEDFVVNIFDHKTIEMHESLAGTPVYRRVFRTLDQSTLRLGPDHELILRTGPEPNSAEVEISVVYFRTTYDPKDYAFDGSWAIRAMIERSRAIKCPSLALQLVGAKVFQTVLAKPEVLKHYLRPFNREDHEGILDTFVSFYAVNKDTLALVEKLGADKFVLKQNREGGGYNYFGQEIVRQMRHIIQTGSQEEYQLMDYINQRPQVGYVVGQRSRPLASQKSETNSNLLNTELGIFGSILATPDGNEVFNSESSYLLRVKPIGTNELGIMSGLGAVSSLNLTE